MHRIQFYILVVSLSVGIMSHAQQARLSIATDLGVQRSLKAGQRYTAFGHTVQTQFNFTPNDGIYLWLSYYTNGTFSNTVTADAKSIFTLPRQITYRNTSVMGFKHFSAGYKKYFKGGYESEENWNLYGYAGFGLLFGKIVNNASVAIDTNNYKVPVRNGEAKFKRLTFDLGLGYEVPIGGDVYLYSEVRCWLPASDYPSKYLLLNDNAPLVGMLNAGIRILF